MENIYLKTLDKKTCNGCGICVKECPVEAIKMVEDTEGFLYPVIDEEKCINCNKCKNICSNFNDSKDYDKAYMAINKNIDELKNSSSGGMFYILAKYVISNNGVVFGVEYDDNMEAHHNYYTTLEDCKKFQGSKYVRSNLNNSFEKVQEFLKNDKYVLFTGTPCQCNALKLFLKKDYDKLIICDLICHSNPSPKVLKKYIEEVEKDYNKKIINFYHRPKENGWHNALPIIEFSDSSKINDKIYLDAFGFGLISRPSCYDCMFTGTNRVSDFTIADLWGNDKICPEIKDDNTGISLFCINSKKADEIFEKIKDKMEFKKVDKKFAFSFNHYCNIKKHHNRKKFFENIDKEPVIENMRKCLKVSIVRKIVRKVKKIIKKS